MKNMCKSIKSSVAAATLAISAATAVASEEPSLTFIHMTDCQFGFYNYELEAKRYEKAVELINLDADNDQPEFMLMTGDMVNDARAETNADFLLRSEILEIPYHLVVGNHDYNNSESLQKLYQESFGKDYYWFDSADGDYRIICLNTNLWKDPGSNTAKFDEWVEMAFAQAKSDDKIIIAAGHCPIFLKSVDEPDDPYYNLPMERRQQVLKLFKDYNIIAYFGGHCHMRLDLEWEGIRFLYAETTGVNFDNSPHGYRVVTIKNRSVADKFVGIK